ncbi:hypothetical protein [Streptomyces sp. CMB-StM0423]|uniref:hypothetical protein n=1 Tax=Streptomyces sp. CMB-StM0423 TaxID=2059884 RepID=UPI00131A7B08|nr:hypothetical protein [Streptomyces sp. CMB-StM0423]
MIQHVRRGLARLAPPPVDSIPLPALFQTADASVFLLTFRFGSALTAAVMAAAVIWPAALPTEVQMMLTASALSDRSAVSFIRIRYAD